MDIADLVFGVLQLVAGVLLLPTGIVSIARRTETPRQAGEGFKLSRPVPQGVLCIAAGTASLTAAAIHFIR